MQNEGSYSYTLVAEKYIREYPDSQDIYRVIRHELQTAGPTEEIGYSFLCTTHGNSGCGINFDFNKDADEWKLKIPANENSGKHEVTVSVEATGKAQGATLASTDFIIELMDKDDFELGLVAVPDIKVYRQGGAEESRKINYLLFDENLTNSINAPFLRSRVELASRSADFSIIQNVIQQNTLLENLAPGGYPVEVEVKFDGQLQKYPKTIIAKVEKRLIDVSFFNGDAEIPDLHQKVEYGKHAEKPKDEDAALQGFMFEGVWYAAEDKLAEFDFSSTAVTELPVRVYGAYTEVFTEYGASFTVTLSQSEAAQLQPGEFIWINHGAYGGTQFQDQVLQKQPDGSWTVTLPNIQASIGPWAYKFYAEPSGTSMGWNYPANSRSEQVFTYSGGASNAVSFTVTEWLGRPVSAAGELFKKGGMEPVEGKWAVSALQPEWAFTGLNTGPSSIWLTGNAPGPHTGSGCFTDYHTSAGDIGTNWLTNTSAPITILQNVQASANGLSAGTQVTLRAWILRVTDKSSDFALVCGSQQYAIPLNSLPQGNDHGNWRQISRTFTLAAGDIVNDQVKAGLQYKSTSTERTGTGGCRTMVDDFSFVVVNQ
jgi:hypothetical protein